MTEPLRDDPDRRSGLGRRLRILALVVAIVVLIVVVMALVGGSGGHGPSRHGGTDHSPPIGGHR